MTELEKIEQEVYNNGMFIVTKPDLKGNSKFVKFRNEITIYIKIKEVPETKKRIIAISHELGHYYTLTYYNDKASVNLIRKYEYLANINSIERLLPPEEILGAVWHGCCGSVRHIAEYVDYPVDFVEMAINIYQRMRKLPYLYEMPHEYFEKCVHGC